VRVCGVWALCFVCACGIWAVCFVCVCGVWALWAIQLCVDGVVKVERAHGVVQRETARVCVGVLYVCMCA
jgi:hypothetical protein